MYVGTNEMKRVRSGIRSLVLDILSEMPIAWIREMFSRQWIDTGEVKCRDMHLETINPGARGYSHWKRNSLSIIKYLILKCLILSKIKKKAEEETVARPVLSGSGSQSKVILLPSPRRGHLAMPGDAFGCHSWGGGNPWASSG